MSKKRNILILLSGTPLAFLHAILVTWITHQIFSGVEPDWPMYWLFTFATAPWLIVIVLLLRLIPVSVFYPVAKYATSFLPTKPVVQDIDNFAVPFLIMGILPVIVYLISMPLILLYAFKKRIRKTKS
jgi:hypothetical protein